MMRTRTLSAMLAVSAVTICWTACTTPPPPAAEPPPIDMAVITAEIQAMEDAYAVASVNKDPDAILAYYADDVVSYSRDMEPLVGKAALRQRLADQMANDTLGTKPTFKVLELFMGKDNLTEIGSWTDTDANGTVTDHGTYFSVFRKIGDKWICIRDISVSAQPKEAAKPMAVNP